MTKKVILEVIDGGYNQFPEIELNIDIYEFEVKWPRMI